MRLHLTAGPWRETGSGELWMKTGLSYFRSVLSCLAHGNESVVSIRQELKLATDWF